MRLILTPGELILPPSSFSSHPSGLLFSIQIRRSLTILWSTLSSSAYLLSSCSEKIKGSTSGWSPILVTNADMPLVITTASTSMIQMSRSSPMLMIRWLTLLLLSPLLVNTGYKWSRMQALGRDGSPNLNVRTTAYTLIRLMDNKISWRTTTSLLTTLSILRSWRCQEERVQHTMSCNKKAPSLTNWS